MLGLKSSLNMHITVMHLPKNTKKKHKQSTRSGKQTKKHWHTGMLYMQNARNMWKNIHLGHPIIDHYLISSKKQYDFVSWVEIMIIFILKKRGEPWVNYQRMLSHILMNWSIGIMVIIQLLRNLLELQHRIWEEKSLLIIGLMFSVEGLGIFVVR